MLSNWRKITGENVWERDDGARIVAEGLGISSKPWIAYRPNGTPLDTTNGKHGHRRRFFSTPETAARALLLDAPAKVSP